MLDVIIGRAVRLGWLEGGQPQAYNEQVAQAWTAFYALPPHRVANLVMAAVSYLLDASQSHGDAPPTDEGEPADRTSAGPEVDEEKQTAGPEVEDQAVLNTLQPLSAPVAG